MRRKLPPSRDIGLAHVRRTRSGRRIRSGLSDGKTLSLYQAMLGLLAEKDFEAVSVARIAKAGTAHRNGTLPPRAFEPAGVEFVTGSITAQGAAEVQALTFPRDNRLRPFYVHDRARRVHAVRVQHNAASRRALSVGLERH